MNIYPQDENPALALYRLWYTLLSAQGTIHRPSKTLYPDQDEHKPNPNDWRDWSCFMPRVSYGDKATGIGIAGWDDNGEPIISYGAYYSRRFGIHAYMELRADGAFRLIHPHGDNHNRLERHTFLGFGVRSGKYFWYVSPDHSAQQSLDSADFLARRSWVYEKSLRHQNQMYYKGTKNWVSLVRENDEWLFRSTDPGSEHDQVLVRNYLLAEKIYRRNERKHYQALGQTPPRLAVRSNGTLLIEEDAVRQIAVLLDVDAPAKVQRPKIAEEAMV